MARRKLKRGIAAMFVQGLGPVKKRKARIWRARTENREGCPWQKKPRRLWGNAVKGIRQSSPVSSVQGVPELDNEFRWH